MLQEKIVEQEAEHHKLVEENNVLTTEKEVMVGNAFTMVNLLSSWWVKN